MLRIINRLILVGALAGILVVPMAQPASAATGDSIVTGCGRVDGAPYGLGCDAYMKTNKCTSGVVSFRLLWVNPSPPIDDDRVVVFHDGTGGCNVKIRHRIRFGTEGLQWLPTVYVGANDEGWIGQQPRNRYHCWVDYSVQRRDGTWLTHRHYSSKWGHSATWRAACRTDQ